MMQTATQAPRLAFHYANITHDSIEKMSWAQKEQALHELIDLRDITKRHIYNPDVSPQTRIFALATILERAQKTGTKRPNGERVLESVTQQVPTWIGDKDKEGSLVHRLGISRNAISNEIKAFKEAGLVSTFYRDTENSFNQHLDLAIAPEMLTHLDLLPTKGERPRRKPVMCKACGSFDLIKRVVCPDCGTIHSEAYVNQEEEEDGTEETVSPNTPPGVEEEHTENEQAQQPLCTREVHSVIVMNNCTREVHSDLTDWLQKRIGSGGQIFATGKPNSQDKYLPFYGPFHIESYLVGDRENIYGSQLRRADGTTWIWSADIDPKDTDIYSRIDEFLSRLASAGIPAIAWLRREGSAHIEITFSAPVIPEEADAYILSIIPEFSAVKERYPVTTTNKLSWPLYYRKGNTVHPCTARYMSDELHSLTVANDETTLHQLAILAEECITPAHLVSEYIQAHPIVKPEPKKKPAAPVGGYLEKDLAKDYISEFNAQRDWSDIVNLAGGFIRGKFLAVWRGDRTPNVAIDPRTDLAKDFARQDEPAMDKYDVWCRIQAQSSGIDWQMFKRRDLTERCAYRRKQLEEQAS